MTAASKPGEIYFYDWDANVLGDRGPDTPFAGARGLFEAVSVASREVPRAERTDRPLDAPADLSVAEADRRNDSAGERYYLFGADQQLIAGPASTGAAPTRAAGPNRAATDRVLRVPQGIVVLEAERSPDQPASVRRFFVLEDDSELSRSDIEDPEASSDRQTREPVVSFDFTDRGRAAFAAVTKRIAKRGAKAALPPGASEAERAAAFERFAIAVDDQIVSRAAINFLANPEGIDGREGAQISGIGSPDETRRLAALLDAVPLAAELIPLSPPK